MRKYIDADELKKVFRDTEDAEYARWTLAGVIGEIDNIEAADVAEVRHGRWEYKPAQTNDLFGFYICSECGAASWASSSPYCPNCGAKMDEVEDEQ